MWPQHKVEVYEQMVADLRHTLRDQAQGLAPNTVELLEAVIDAAVHTIDSSPEIVAVGLPELEPDEGGSVEVEPAQIPAKPAIDPFTHGAHAEANRLAKARQLARWLWDRNIDGEQVLGFTNKWRNKIARAAGVNPPSTLETWTVAVELMGRMAQLADSGTQPGASERHHLDEHEQWVSES